MHAYTHTYTACRRAELSVNAVVAFCMVQIQHCKSGAVCLQMHAHTTCIHTQTHEYIASQVLYAFKCMHTQHAYIHKRMNTLQVRCYMPSNACTHKSVYIMHKQTNTCMYIQMQVYIHERMHTQTHAYIHECIHTQTHAHIHKSIHAYTNT